MSVRYNPSIATSGLIMYLDMINRKSYPTTGVIWTDISANGNNATFNSTPVFSGGFWNANGSPYASSTALVNYNFGTGLTACAWVNRPTGDINYRGIIGNCYVTGAGFDMRFGREDYGGGANNGTRLGCSVITSSGTYSTNISGNLGSWAYYSMTYDGANLKTYKNGQFFGSIAASGNISGTTNPVFIGSNAQGGEPYTGFYESAQVYNYPLSSGDIYQNFCAHRGRFGV